MVPYMILQIFDPRQKDETRFKILFQIFYNIAITAATLYIFKTKGWSFGPNSAWGSKETLTIGETHATLFYYLLFFIYQFSEIYWDDIEEVQRMFW